MPYVKRNATGQIISVHLNDNSEATEVVAADSTDFLEFIMALGDSAMIREYFDRADKDFIRVIEDVIYSLIEKRVLSLTDLPRAAQKKLAERRNLRGTKGDLGMIIDRSDNIL